MQLRYHVDKATYGLLVLEQEPQIRSLFVSSQIKETIRVPLPYIYFIIKYDKVKGDFVYNGIYGCGLSICGSLNSIKSFSDSVFSLPTDTHPYFKSYVCTNHKYDGLKFETIFELANTVISLWYGVCHILYYRPFLKWEEETLTNLKNGKWHGSTNFSKITFPHDYQFDSSSRLTKSLISGGEQVINIKWDKNFRENSFTN